MNPAVGSFANITLCLMSVFAKLDGNTEQNRVLRQCDNSPQQSASCDETLPLVQITSRSNILGQTATAGDEQVTRWIADVQSVGPQGEGSNRARTACDRLIERGPSIIPDLLVGMDTPNLVAANWLRMVFDRIVAKSIQSEPAALPRQALRSFVLESSRQGRVRRLALDVLSRLEPTAPASIIPSLLDDPEFRRDAVAAAVRAGDEAAANGANDAAVESYVKAFGGARDADQVRVAATKLKSLGREVSITDHFGFLVDWYLIGPFDAPEFRSFSSAFPPELGVDLDATYESRGGRIGWTRHHTPDEFGTVDLVKAITATDDAAAYATTSVELDGPRAIELRFGADDNMTIWVNGKKVFAKEEWQNGTRLDRFIVPVEFQQGRNQILLKVCQGPKYRDPGMANPWSFQIRICDGTGKGVVLSRPISQLTEAERGAH